MKVLYKSYMLVDDFLELPRGTLVLFDPDIKSYMASTTRGVRYFDRDFVASNPGLFEPVDEDIVDFELEPADRGMVHETPNTDVVRENEQAKEYMGQFARALSVENLTIKEEKEMRNRDEVLNRLEEVKATIVVLEDTLNELYDQVDVAEGIKNTLDGMRQQYYVLNWVLNN